MPEATPAPVHVAPARAGRPPSGTRVYRPEELVRVEIRIPAHLARQLFERANATGRAVSATATALLSDALSDSSAGRMP
ncbi:hypothetical protein CTE05_34310 [Cellulomonas terrae]|uniref:Arc-like DNA binding domain-containing protein n=1 Tax=Cellulomonas terrae TaxID=311234 RepID=A0A511JPN6_9CELL|nr:hypothetical protein CTE05_34310 [Cellulomonas terrae]